MSKVFVCQVPGRTKELDAIKAILIDIGCEIVVKRNLPEAIEDCDVLVVLLCKEAFTDSIVASAIQLAVKLGKKIVGIWAQDATGTEIPEAFEAYGESTVTLEKSQIQKVMELGTSVWQTPKRELRPEPATARHKC